MHLKVNKEKKERKKRVIIKDFLLNIFDQFQAQNITYKLFGEILLNRRKCGPPSAFFLSRIVPQRASDQQLAD